MHQGVKPIIQQMNRGRGAEQRIPDEDAVIDVKKLGMDGYNTEEEFEAFERSYHPGAVDATSIAKSEFAQFDGTTFQPDEDDIMEESEDEEMLDDDVEHFGEAYGEVDSLENIP